MRPMPLHNLLIFVGILVFQMSAILIVARRGGKSLVTECVQPVQPYERLTCKMEPYEMLETQPLPMPDETMRFVKHLVETGYYTDWPVEV